MVELRQCFRPRKGFVYIQADFDGLELRTLSQVCKTLLGFSHLGDALNAGQDPHLGIASTVLQQPYDSLISRKEEPVVVNARQVGKVANFGFPGGLGGDKLVYFAKKAYKVTITEQEAWALKRTWFVTWPEMPKYFDLIKKALEVGNGTLEQLFTKRLRGGLLFTNGANTLFQGLGADATHRAGWYLSKACYVERQSPLFGSRIVNYPHDEFIIETRDRPEAHDAAIETKRLMLKGANEFLPDVPAKTTPCLMRVWSKKAKPLYNAQGRLIPWEPEGFEYD
jgi:DNA polymerase I-like protein with 3'-5' exonuclease and polymerase domains